MTTSWTLVTLVAPMIHLNDMTGNIVGCGASWLEMVIVFVVVFNINDIA